VSSTIKIKRSGVAGKQPNTATLSVGELAINYKDQKLYSSNGTAVFQVGGGTLGGSLVTTTTKTLDALKGTDTVITGITASIATDYLKVSNASATYATKAYAAANSYVKSVLANTNSYISTKVNSSTFNSALANTNTYIATRATWSALTATNTAIRTLVSDRLQVANAAATYQTKAVERAALANTNASIATQTSRITLVNTNLTGTNTALRTLISDRLQVANAVATYQTKAIERAALANTNSYIATKVNTTTFNSALANTNSYIAAQATRITLVNTNLTGTNTAIRALDAQKLSVANATTLFAAKATWSGLTSTNTALRSLISDRMQVANAVAIGATKASWSALTSTNTALRTLISDRLQVANAAATYLTKNNPVVTGTLTANGSTGTSGYYLRTSGTGVYWSPVAASGATWSALTTTNTALRTLISDRLQVANAASIYQTKTVERAALANTNSWNTSQDSRITLVNTNLTATNTAIRGLFSSYLTTSSASSTYQTQAGMSSYLTTSTASSTYAPLASPSFTGTVSSRKVNLTCSGSGWDDGLNIYSSAGTNRWNFLTDSGAGNAMRIAYNNTEAININTGVYTSFAGSARAPIFYDSNDTGYYADPNGTSNFNVIAAAGRISTGYDPNIVNSISCSNWFRSSGGSGWYNGSYGGGIWMEDSTWVKVYGNKQFYSQNWMQSDSSVRAPIFYDSNDTGYYCDPNYYSSMYQMRLWGNDFWIRGGSPTIHFQDIDQYSAALHNNSNLFYVLRGGVDDVSWSTVGSGWWPCYWNLTNNDCTMGGNISAAYNIVAYASDKRLKENIVEIPNALDKIKQIRGVTFDWNDEAEVLGFTPETKYNDLGVIAQEIQAVLPQAVKPAPFDQWFPDPSGDYEQEYLDQMMGTSRSGENYLTVQLDRIVPLLIEGIKEQQNQIEELLNRIKVLEQK
jgi:hypothetical protein